MKLSVVFMVVFAILVVDSQIPDRDSSMLPIPILSERATASLSRAITMMRDAIKVAVANEAFDKSGALTGIRLLLEQMNPMLAAFTQISGAVTSIITRSDPLAPFITAITESFANIGSLYSNLEGKIKPSEYMGIVNAINDIIPKIMNLAVFMPQARLSAPRAVGLDLQMVISDWSTAVEGLGNAAQVLARAIQRVVNTRIQAINAQRSINRSLSVSGSYLSRTSTQLNAALENARNQLGVYSRTTLTQISQGYSSITSNPTRWHQSVINKVYAFFSSYSDLIHDNYLPTLATSVKTAQIAIAAAIIRQTRATGLLIAELSTSIIDQAARMDNPRASECSRRQLYKLSSSSLNRLAQCITSEASNIRGISTQGQHLLTVARTNAVSSVSQFPTCNTGTSDQCNAQLTAIYDIMVARATADLGIAATQVTNTLTAISGRIVSCLGAVAQNIATTTEPYTAEFNTCLTSGQSSG